MSDVRVGHKVLYDGRPGVVVAIGQGEWGPTAEVRVESGAVIRTTPGLDHRWNQPKDSQVLTLCQLMWGRT